MQTTHAEILFGDVHTPLVPGLTGLNWLQLLLLGNDVLQSPRRFLARATQPETEVHLPDCYAKVDQNYPYDDLKQLALAYLPFYDQNRTVSTRKIQHLLLLQRLGEINLDDLAVSITSSIRHL